MLRATPRAKEQNAPYVIQDENVAGQVESFSKNDKATNNNDTENNNNIYPSMVSVFDLVLKSNLLSSKEKSQ